MKLHLPELPPHLYALSREDDIAHVESLSEGRWEDPEHCYVCQGKRSFRWLARDSVEWRTNQIQVDPNSIHEYECACRDQFIAYRNLLLANIPLNYQVLSMWDMASEKHQTFLMEQLEGLEVTVPAGLGLLLQGSHGTGKTMTAALLAKGAVALGYRVYYSTFNGLLDRFSDTWRDAEKKRYFHRHMTGANLLVIDDLGKETRQSYQANVTNMAKSFISECLRERTQNMSPTYLTSNLGLDQIGQGYGMDVFSLLTERTETREYLGEDFRPAYQARIRAEVKERLSRPIVMETGL